MEHSLFLIGVAVLAFVSTNVDGLLVLLGFLSDPAYRTWQVVLGQYLGIGFLVAASAALSLVSLIIPPVYVGLFGVVPVALGLSKLRRVLLRRESAETAPYDRASRHRKILAIAAVTIANGGDNVATYVPLFAGHTGSELAGFVAVFGAMTALWCGLAHYLVAHCWLGIPLRSWGRVLLPWLLIALGLIILSKTGALGFVVVRMLSAT